MRPGKKTETQESRKQERFWPAVQKAERDDAAPGQGVECAKEQETPNAHVGVLLDPGRAARNADDVWEENPNDYDGDAGLIHKGAAGKGMFIFGAY